MITGLFIFDRKGDILISKLYKDGVKRSISDVFRIHVINSTNKTEIRSPILTLGSTSFIHIKSERNWIVAATRSNQDCSTILEFLYKFESLLKTIIGNLTNENICNNFFDIYQILDEVIQFGYPINLELGYLKAVLPNVDGNSKRLVRRNSTLLKQSNKSSELLNAMSNITWRSNGIKYRRNEIFLNVEEQINVLTNEQSDILRSYVEGKVIMKTHLSGMPQCRFGLNDSVTLEDYKFHQCVELEKFDTSKVIQFIPPDGEFQLMSYTCRQDINLPFQITAQVQQSGTKKLQYKILVRATYSNKISSSDIQLKVPTPKGVVGSNINSAQGKAKYQPEDDNIVWKFNKVFGGTESILLAEIELTEIEGKKLATWSRPPIKLEFVIDMFSVSGLSVEFLRVDKVNYRTVKWVKYASQSGSYEIRY